MAGFKTSIVATLLVLVGLVVIWGGSTHSAAGHQAQLLQKDLKIDSLRARLRLLERSENAKAAARPSAVAVPPQAASATGAAGIGTKPASWPCPPEGGLVALNTSAAVFEAAGGADAFLAQLEEAATCEHTAVILANAPGETRALFPQHVLSGVSRTRIEHTMARRTRPVDAIRAAHHCGA
jgi:hypothetical protein